MSPSRKRTLALGPRQAVALSMQRSTEVSHTAWPYLADSKRVPQAITRLFPRFSRQLPRSSIPVCHRVALAGTAVAVEVLAGDRSHMHRHASSAQALCCSSLSRQPQAARHPGQDLKSSPSICQAFVVRWPLLALAKSDVSDVNKCMALAMLRMVTR